MISKTKKKCVADKASTLEKGGVETLPPVAGVIAYGAACSSEAPCSEGTICDSETKTCICDSSEGYEPLAGITPICVKGTGGENSGYYNPSPVDPEPEPVIHTNGGCANIAGVAGANPSLIWPLLGLITIAIPRLKRRRHSNLS